MLLFKLLTHQLLLLVQGKWIEYDDDNPIPQREEDITKLSGGGKIAANCLLKAELLLRIPHASLTHTKK
jgi:hypothetical protein